MDQESDDLLEYQNALRRIGVDPMELARQAESLAGLSGPELEEALQSFHLAANQHRDVNDSDYGAMLLESLGDRSADPARKARFYDQAKLRAAIFASYATSGGEGLARSIDVERLARKLDQLSSGNPDQ